MGFEAYGDTLEELFANATIPTYSIMTDVGEIEEEEEWEAQMQAECFVGALAWFLGGGCRVRIYDLPDVLAHPIKFR